MDVAGMNIGVNGWKTLAFKAMREKLLFSRKRIKKITLISKATRGKTFVFKATRKIYLVSRATKKTFLFLN